MKKTLVAIPMKGLANAKSRLAPVLDATQRQRLALALFARTLHFFGSAFPAFDVAVVTPCRQIAARARTAGAHVLLELAPTSLNAAAQCAARWAVAQGYERLILVPADIPVLLREEIEQMLALSDRHALAIAEARDGGTNMLLMSPPRECAFQFGADSARGHESMARACGVSAQRRYLPFLGHDLDTPEDCLVLSHALQEREDTLLACLRDCVEKVGDAEY